MKLMNPPFSSRIRPCAPTSVRFGVTSHQTIPDFPLDELALRHLKEIKRLKDAPPKEQVKVLEQLYVMQALLNAAAETFYGTWLLQDQMNRIARHVRDAITLLEDHLKQTATPPEAESGP